MNECRTPGKTEYPTEGKAMKALKAMPKHKSKGNVPYKCANHWHVGRITRQTLKDINKR